MPFGMRPLNGPSPRNARVRVSFLKASSPRNSGAACFMFISGRSNRFRCSVRWKRNRRLWRTRRGRCNIRRGISFPPNSSHPSYSFRSATLCTVPNRESLLHTKPQSMLFRICSRYHMKMRCIYRYSRHFDHYHPMNNNELHRTSGI